MVKFTMVGTEHTGQYVGLANIFAQFGFRDLGNDVYRVRVEPIASIRAAVAVALPGWKAGMGGGVYRFSTVVSSMTGLKAALNQALEAAGTSAEFTYSDNCPEWLKQLHESALPLDGSKSGEHERLVALVQQKKVPGCNFAKNWSRETLVKKLA